MANHLRKDTPSHGTGRSPPRQPDYPDEISVEQIEAIKKLVDPEAKHAEHRKVLYPDAW